MSKKNALVIAAVVTSSIVFSTPSVADPPVRYSFTLDDVVTYDCGDGVVLTEPFTYSESGRDYYKDGELIRTVGQAFFDGVITNGATGAQFGDSNHYGLDVDYVANTLTFRGALFQLHPAEGGPVLLLDAGTVTGDLDTGDVIRESAKHPSSSPNIFMDHTEVVCEAVGA